MIKYCPTCNRSSKDARFVGEFCEFCVIDRVSRGFKAQASVEYCERCGRIRTNMGHRTFNKETLAGVLSKALCNSKCTIKVRGYDDKSADVLVTYPVGNDHVMFEKKIALKLVHKICLDCYRKSSGYYEAIVQIRGEKEKVGLMLQKLKKFLEARGAFMTKLEGRDNGVDAYTSDKIMTKNFFIFNKLPTKASYTLYSIRNGKKIFRNTYLLRL
jgi:NMD protein affecting ribosome stability and mRNA decay